MLCERHQFVSNIRSLGNLHDVGNEIVTKTNEFMLFETLSPFFGFSKLVKYGQTSLGLNS